MRLDLTEPEIEQIKESLFYHYECADDLKLHDENCRIIAKIDQLQNTIHNSSLMSCPKCKENGSIIVKCECCDTEIDLNYKE